VADVRRTVEILFQGKNNLGASVSGIESSLSGISGEAEKAALSTDQLGDEFDQLGTGPVDNINLLTTALKALAASAVLREFLEANANIDSFRLGVEAVTGETGRASQELEFLRSTADRLGLDLQATTSSYLSLLAATEGTTLAGQQSRDIFEAVAQAMAVLGKSSADTDGALQAITQIVSKGVVSMEELRQQLGERLPGAFQIAAESMGLTTAELNELVSSGTLTAEEFLPALARGLNDTFDVERVSNYRSEVNRLFNAISDAQIAAGEAGLFDLATGLVTGATEELQSATTEVGVYRQAWEQIRSAFTSSDPIGERIKQINEALALATVAALNFGQPIGEAADEAAVLSENLDETAVSAGNVPPPIRDALDVLTDLSTAANATNKLLKEIGVDPKLLSDPIEDAVIAFDKLASLDGVQGDDLFSGLLVTLDRLENADTLPVLARSLAEAFDAGRISAQDLADGYDALRARGESLVGSSNAWGASFEAQAGSLQKSTEASKKAEEQATKTAIELERIASNERIKNIEAVVSLNVAGIEADAERAVAIIETINTAIESTGDLLGGLFENRIDADSWEERRIIEEAIRKEEENREDVLRRQNKLIDAQIAKLRAQTEAIRSGGGQIVVQADGLQPHLEAFMFEIFEALQVRVNEEGYELLLGAA